MKILLVRGAFLNKFEGQNYQPLAKKHQIIGVGSFTAFDKDFSFPVKLFFSPYDLGGRTRLLRGLFNRVLGDSHFLVGFSNFVKKTAGNSGWDIGHIAETYYGYDLQTVRLKQQGLIKKIVSTCWETIAFNNETIVKKKRIKQIVRKAIDLFICPTDRAKHSLIKEGVFEEKIMVIRMGVDLNRFKVRSSRFEDDKKEIIILFVGRLVEEKGVLDLYQAFKQIKNEKLINKNCNVKLKIIGKGYLKKVLLNKARKDGIGKNILVESKPYNQMPKVYQGADVLVVPSRTTKTWEEQYGMVLVEGMASGLPIVAYRSGAIAEVLGDCGILVREGEVYCLAKAIVNLINNNSLMIKLGKMGRRRAEREFNREKIAEKIEEIYKGLWY